MEQLEVVFGLFVVLVVIATLARRIEVPYPILLVLGSRRMVVRCGVAKDCLELP